MEETERDLLIKINTNVKSILEIIKSHETDIVYLKIDNATNKEKINTSEEEIEKLRSETKAHGWINSAGVVIGTIIGFFGR